MAENVNKTRKRKVAIALASILVGSLIFGASIVGVKSFSSDNGSFIETQTPYTSPTPSPTPTPSATPSPTSIPEPIYGPSPV